MYMFSINAYITHSHIYRIFHNTMKHREETSKQETDTVMTSVSMHNLVVLSIIGQLEHTDCTGLCRPVCGLHSISPDGVQANAQHVTQIVHVPQGGLVQVDWPARKGLHAQRIQRKRPASTAENRAVRDELSVTRDSSDSCLRTEAHNCTLINTSGNQAHEHDEHRNCQRR